MKPSFVDDFRTDLAYVVTKGNDNYAKGDIIWVDSKTRSMINVTAGGWYENDEINKTLDKMKCEPTRDYIVETDNRGTRIKSRKYLEELLNRS